MATTFDRIAIADTAVGPAPARRLHYRGLQVRPADLAGVDAPRAGRCMLWRGITFDGVLLDQAATVPSRHRRFYRGLFF